MYMYTRCTKRAFTAFGGLYCKQNPISATMHHNPTVITGNEITVIYITAKGKHRQKQRKQYVSHIYFVHIDRIVWILDLWDHKFGFGIYRRNANFEKVGYLFFLERFYVCMFMFCRFICILEYIFRSI